MSVHDELTLLELSLIATVLGVVWMAIWFKLRADARRSGVRSDRYLYRADLAAGAAPQNLVEVFIKAVLTRPVTVHAVLVGIALIGLVLSHVLGEPTGVAAFGFLLVIFLAAALLFLGSPYVERYFERDEDGGRV